MKFKCCFEKCKYKDESLYMIFEHMELHHNLVLGKNVLSTKSNHSQQSGDANTKDEGGCTESLDSHRKINSGFEANGKASKNPSADTFDSTNEYYDGKFGSLKHNIFLMLSQIEGNLKYADEGSVEKIKKDLGFIKERIDKISDYKEETNPAHYCMGAGCEKYLGYRGYCSDECHDRSFDVENTKEVTKDE